MPREDDQGATELSLTDELRYVLGRAERGDRSALPVLRAILDSDPRIWRSVGDLAAQAQGAWVNLVAGENLLLQESLGRKLAALKAELAGPAASPLECLLVDRVAACWMQTSYADAICAQSKDRSLLLTQLEQLQKRQERAQRGYVAAIKALAVVRKLLPPVATTMPAEEPRNAGTEAESEQVRGGRRGRVALATKVESAIPRKGGRRQEAVADRRRSREPSEATLPEALKDRLRGLVASEN